VGAIEAGLSSFIGLEPGTDRLLYYKSGVRSAGRGEEKVYVCVRVMACDGVCLCVRAWLYYMSSVCLTDKKECGCVCICALTLSDCLPLDLTLFLRFLGFFTQYRRI
jgi:hypothetical protein